MPSKLLVVVVVIPFDRGILDRAGHPLYLTVGPWVVRFCQTMFDPIGFTDQFEPHRPRIDCVSVSGLFCELDAIVRQDRMNLVRHDLNEVLKKLPSRLAIGFLHQLGDCELASPVDGHKEI